MDAFVQDMSSHPSVGAFALQMLSLYLSRLLQIYVQRNQNYRRLHKIIEINKKLRLDCKKEYESLCVLTKDVPVHRNPLFINNRFYALKDGCTLYVHDAINEQINKKCMEKVYGVGTLDIYRFDKKKYSLFSILLEYMKAEHNGLYIFFEQLGDTTLRHWFREAYTASLENIKTALTQSPCLFQILPEFHKRWDVRTLQATQPPIVPTLGCKVYPLVYEYKIQTLLAIDNDFVYFLEYDGNVS